MVEQVQTEKDREKGELGTAALSERYKAAIGKVASRLPMFRKALGYPDSKSQCEFGIAVGSCGAT